MRRVIHYNPRLPHQVDHAAAFERLGFAADPHGDYPADVHVVSGPYYAMKRWLGHPNLLMIDRAFWGDPEHVQLFWLQPDGQRVYANGEKPRPHPELWPWKTREQSALVLADYEQDTSKLEAAARDRFGLVRVRRHPAEGADQPSLESQLARSDVAIATRSTAMFEAIRMGVPGICLDSSNPCAPVCASALDAPLYRGDVTDWIHDMSYKQFRLDEMATAWELLRDVPH